MVFMAQDIFNISDIHSIPRQIMRACVPIDITQYSLEPFVWPKRMRVSDVPIDPDNVNASIRDVIDPIVNTAEAYGAPPQLFTVAYEMILNAYQHGNQQDCCKVILMGHHIEPDLATIVVADQGGLLDPEFCNFIMQLRQDGSQSNFYTFAGRCKPDQNNGTGTFFIHEYTDRVRYFRLPDRGLAVEATKRWSSNLK